MRPVKAPPPPSNLLAVRNMRSQGIPSSSLGCRCCRALHFCGAELRRLSVHSVEIYMKPSSTTWGPPFVHDRYDAHHFSIPAHHCGSPAASAARFRSASI